MTNPIRPTDDDARTLARDLLRPARHGAIAVLQPDGAPMVTRVAVLWHDRALLILVSELSNHTQALKANPTCSVLIGEPGAKGDPLTHPRITLQCNAADTSKSRLRKDWLTRHPKSKLYFDFADFKMLRLEVTDAHLNGGFGKAYHLSPTDLPT